MSLKDLEYDNEQMVGAARRKSKYPRKILRVVLSDGTCRLQPQLTPDDIKVKEEDWSFYNHGNEYQEYDESCPEVIPSGNDISSHPSLDDLNTHHTSNVLSTHHSTNELTSHLPEDHISRLTNEQKDHPLKGLSDLRLTDSRHDVENRYYDTNDSLVYLHDKNMKIENSSLLNSRLRTNDKPKDNTRPHKHQHPEPTPDFPYQCDTCDMLFKTIDLLTDHQTTVHHNNRQFACRYCSKRFNDKYNMRKHVLIHVGEKRHRCQFCDKAFLRKDHLRSHLQTHYNRKFGCKVCGKSFRTLDMYQRHAKTHKTSPSLSMTTDTNPDNPYPDLVNLSKLDNPASIQNGTNNRVKEDNSDTTNVDNGDSLHISNVTSQYGKDLSPGVSKLENFPVTILDEDFNEFWKNSPSVSENDLSITNSPVSSDHNHSFVNGDSPKTEGFSCHICNSSFKTDLSLQLHSQKCSGELRNWQCIKCNIIFDEAKTLKQHYEKVHSVEEPIPSPSRWRCKTCNINYPNSKELSRHYAQAHKDAQIFPCSECPKTFTVWHNLKKHMLIHLGDKKHKCTVCEKGFVRKDHLNSHMKVHLGDGSKFTCPICCKVFRLKQMYLKHMNLHGLEQAYDDSKE